MGINQDGNGNDSYRKLLKNIAIRGSYSTYYNIRRHYFTGCTHYALVADRSVHSEI